jgi:hypothetical protein
MKIMMIRALVLSSIAVCMVMSSGCGIEEGENVPFDSTASELKSTVAHSSITVCGTTCPDRFYPVEYGRNFRCDSDTNPDSRTATCRMPHAAGITVCGTTCPDRFYPVAYGRDFRCDSNANPDSRTATCRMAGR